MTAIVTNWIRINEQWTWIELKKAVMSSFLIFSKWHMCSLDYNEWFWTKMVMDMYVECVTRLLSHLNPLYARVCIVFCCECVDLPLLEEAWIISFLIKSRVAILGKKIQKPIFVIKKRGKKSFQKTKLQSIDQVRTHDNNENQKKNLLSNYKWVNLFLCWLMKNNSRH